MLHNSDKSRDQTSGIIYACSNNVRMIITRQSDSQYRQRYNENQDKLQDPGTLNGTPDAQNNNTKTIRKIASDKQERD
jgi:hypothetical protein